MQTGCFCINTPTCKKKDCNKTTFKEIFAQSMHVLYGQYLANAGEISAEKA